MTELEQKFIEAFKEDAQEMESCYEDITSYALQYASEKLNLSISQVKGILGSLVNKGVLQMDEVNGESAVIYWSE